MHPEATILQASSGPGSVDALLPPADASLRPAVSDSPVRALREGVVEDLVTVLRQSSRSGKIGKLSRKGVLRHAHLFSEANEMAREENAGKRSQHPSPACGAREQSHRTKCAKEAVAGPIVVEGAAEEVNDDGSCREVGIVSLNRQRHQAQPAEGSEGAEHLCEREVDGKGDRGGDHMGCRVHEGPGHRGSHAPQRRPPVAEQSNQWRKKRQLDPQVAGDGYCSGSSPAAERDANKQEGLRQGDVVDGACPEGMGGSEGHQNGQHPRRGLTVVLSGPPPRCSHGDHRCQQVERDKGVGAGKDQTEACVELSEQGIGACAGLPGLVGEGGQVVEFMPLKAMAFNRDSHQSDNERQNGDQESVNGKARAPHGVECRTRLCLNRVMALLRRVKGWHFAGAVAVFVFLAWPILSSFGSGIWGPSDPFGNGDFNGGWWLWWASAEFYRGTDWTQAVAYPEGAVSLARVIPNPTDMAVLGLLGGPTVLKWNLVQLVHLLATLVAGVHLARVAGASRFSSLAAACLIAGSPVMLHEVAGGRPSNLIVWPALLSLSALIQGRPVRSGAWAALQTLLYLWHGAVLFLVGLVLVRDRRVALRALLSAGLFVTPYLLWLLMGNQGVPAQAPPAGYTALPLSGLWGLDSVPERFQLHPLLLPVALLALKGHRRWLAAGAVGLVIAVGPWPTWALGDSLGAGPMAWIEWALPPFERMHHPVRASLIALPVLGVAAALGLDAFARGRWVGAALIVLVLWNPGEIRRAATYNAPSEIPFSEVEIPGEGPVVDLLGMTHRSALSAQTVHRRSIAEPLLFRRGQHPDAQALQALSRGMEVAPSLWDNLEAQGFEYVLVWDRIGDVGAAERLVEESLGPPVAPGVYRLSERNR